MKSKIKFLTILLGIIIFSVLFSKQASAQQGNVSFQVFYDELSPYGQWVNHPNYGYIWIPDANEDFVPYSSNGYWVNSTYGWTWVSDYEWGWAPFHYGRWDYDDYYGWFWLPDNQWGPAWVTWRRANGYYGWSPMRPGISITLSFGRRYDRDRDYWMFVRDRDLQRRDIGRYYVSRNDHDRIIRNSTVISKTYVDSRRHATYVSGPDRADVQRISGKRINPVSIRDNSRPGQKMNNGELRIYRPQMRNSTDRDKRPVPKQVTRPENVRQPSVRNEATRPGSVKRQTTQPQRQTTQPQRQVTQPQRQTTQPQRQVTQPQRQTTQPQRQTTQPQRQAIPPEQIKRQQKQEVQIQKRDQIQKEQKQRENQKVTPPANTNRKTETTQPQRSKSERDKRSEEKKEREERK
ncbi:MAG: hypothetical protein ACD_77C00407G0007 [uncultured bacterium]|nr:MAG: hypothetical protein ACD_77C00407G0007 [uncultured bacterium]HBY01383.1 hypothetical protein [Rikenellaceae bacterium]